MGAPHAAHFLKAAHKDVFAHRHGLHQVKLLIDNAHAPVEGFHRGGLLNDLPVEDYLAAVLGVDAGENLHQRGFAGAVFAHQAVDLAPFDPDGYVVQGLDAGEALVHMGHGKDILAVFSFHANLLVTSDLRCGTAARPSGLFDALDGGGVFQGSLKPA